MIMSYDDKRLKRLLEKDEKRGLPPAHARILKRQLLRLNAAASPEDMNLAGWNLKELHGDLTGVWQVKVSGAFRLRFRFETGHARDVWYGNTH